MIFTNEKINQIAREQSAIDANCSATDFLNNKNKVVISKENNSARKYLQLPFDVQLISYGNNIVASVNEKYRDFVAKYIDRPDFFHCFETPALQVLNDEMSKDGKRVCFMAEYFLPDLDKLQKFDCPFQTKVMTQDDFRDLYLPEWGNALCEERKELDVLGVGAFDGNKLVGLAGCSADCEKMWQIGIDVLPEYRRKGIAKALTSQLATETLNRGKVPFYCAAWSNIRSVRNALSVGFRPSWVEVTVKDKKFVDKENKIYD